MEKYSITGQQRRLWIDYSVNPSSCSYNTNICFEFKGALNIKKLRDACSLVTEYFDSFRSYFDEKESQCYQYILDQVELNFEYEDLRLVSDEKDMINAIKDEILTKPFDLRTSPIYRFNLLRVGDEHYYFFVVIHHIVSDGYSAITLMKFINVAYNNPREKLDLIFKIKDREDYYNFLEENYSKEAVESDIQYWLENIVDVDYKINFRKYLGRSNFQLEDGTKVAAPQKQAVSLSENETILIKKNCRRLKTTVFNFLATIFAIMIGKSFGKEEIILMMPVSIRPPGFEDSFGFYVNNVPLKVILDQNFTICDVVQQINSQRREDKKHLNVPLFDLINRIKESGHTMVRDMFSMTFSQTLPSDLIDFNDIKSNQLGSGYNIGNDDLAFIFLYDKKLQMSIEYKQEIFDETYIKNFIRSFIHLSVSVTNYLDVKLSKLSIISSSERDRILNKFSLGRGSYNSEESVLQNIYQWKDSKDIAIKLVDKELIYSDLFVKVDALAYILINDWKIHKGKRLGICLDRSELFIVAILAALKVGGVFVPIDFDFPEERIHFIIEDANLDLLITQEELLKRSSRFRCPFIDLTNLSFNEVGKIEDGVKFAKDDPIYIIYTSGTTGKPKGVQMSHANLSCRIGWRMSNFDLGADDVFLQRNNYSFDPAIGEIFWALAIGAKLVIAPAIYNKDPALLANLIMKERVNFADFSTSFLQIFLTSYNLKWCHSLKIVFCGGEVLRQIVVNNFYKSLPNATLFNMYGPTEITIDATSYKCLPQQGYDRVPIGQPLDDTSCYILDDDLNLCPIGIVGNLYIGGSGVSLGYLGQGDLNEKQFIDNPFDREKGEKIYNTNDLARFDDDGNINFIGRTDGQIKIRGFRVEVGEIEEVIILNPKIESAIVICQELDEDRKRLCAFLVIKEGVSFNLRAFKDSLKFQLPNYMIPSSFVTLDVMPLLPSGKIDREQLVNIKNFADFSGEKEFIEPRSSLEKEISNIFSLVLKTEKIGIDDDFFDMGGDSLMAISVASMMRQNSGIDISAICLYNNPTIRSLVQYLKCQKQVDDRPCDEIDVSLDFLDKKFSEINVATLSSSIGILLTAPNSFNGIYLLASLLKITTCPIFCLTRDGSSKSSILKLERRLIHMGVWDVKFREKIRVINSNLLHPNFGISQKDYYELSENVDLIYHNACAYSQDKTIAKLININLTRDLLEFSVRGKIKTLHYFSTVAVFQSYGYKGRKMIDDNTELEHLSIMQNEYAKTRWIAEKIVREGQNNGLPIIIYRIDSIFANQDASDFDDADIFNNFIKAIVASGYCPDINYSFNTITVDYFIRNIIKISQVSDFSFCNRAFHLINEKGLELKLIIEILRDFGYNVQLCSYKFWLNYVIEGENAHLSKFFSGISELFKRSAGKGSSLPEFLSDNNYPRVICSSKIVDDSVSVNHLNLEFYLRKLLFSSEKESFYGHVN